MKQALIVLLALLLVPLPTAPAWAQTTEADVYVAQAVLDFDEQRYEAAFENLRRALDIEPDHVEALYYSGVIRMAQRRPAEAVPFLERARAKAPAHMSVAFQLGLAFFAQQQYDRAQPLLEQVFRGQPDRESLGYYVGFMRYRTKDYQSALSAFRAGRSTDPEIQQLTRLYTGLAFAVLGLPAQAAAEVEQALRLAPGSALTGPAERLRDTITAARQRERRFSAELRLGFFYDDNVAVVPDPASREPLVPILRLPKHESTGELAGLRAEYVWFRSDKVDATLGYSFFGTYNNEIPNFNVTNHFASTGAIYKTALGTMPAQAGLQYAFDALFLDENEFVRRSTVTLFGALVESELHLTQLYARYQNKKFSREERIFTPPPVPAEKRSADNTMVGFLHFLRFAQDRHFLKAGYQFDYDDTEGRNYRYRGHRFLVGGQYTLGWQSLRLKYDFDLHIRDYLHRNDLLPTTDPDTKRRADQEWTNILRAELPLPRNLTLSGEIQQTSVNSNLKVFDYHRNVYSLILSWTY